MRAAWVVMAAGLCAAMIIGKLPPALPALQRDLGVTLMEAGFLLSLVQVATLSMGLFLGLATDGFGLRRSMLVGLSLMSVASLTGGWAGSATLLLVLRAFEGLGFLLTSLPAPAVLRRLVPPERVTQIMGIWGAYVPFGTALAMLLGPAVILAVGWYGWWWLIALFCVLCLLAVWHWVPPDPPKAPQPAGAGGWTDKLRLTLASTGPWLLFLTFCAYAAQWMAVIGFLPTIYAQAGVSGWTLGVLMALVPAMNIFGNVAAGQLLHRGAEPGTLLITGFVVMALGAWLAFAGLELSTAVRYGGMLLFSLFGGLVPGTLFALVPRLAPDSSLISTTVGWMLQGSSLGQFSGPPAVAWLSGLVGGWQWTWAATGVCALLGCLLATRFGRLRSGLPVHR